MALRHQLLIEQQRRDFAEAHPFEAFEEEVANPTQPFIRKTLQGLSEFAKTLPTPPAGYDWTAEFQTNDGRGFDEGDTVFHARFKLIPVPAVRKTD